MSGASRHFARGLGAHVLAALFEDDARRGGPTSLDPGEGVPGRRKVLDARHLHIVLGSSPPR